MVVAAPRHLLPDRAVPAVVLHGAVDDVELLPAGGERREGPALRHRLPLTHGLHRRRRRSSSPSLGNAPSYW